MHWLTDHFRIKHQYVDGLVTPANLKFGYELQCLAFTLIYRCLRLNAQIDIVTTCSIVDAGAEHRNSGIGAQYFPYGIANDFLAYVDRRIFDAQSLAAYSASGDFSPVSAWSASRRNCSISCFSRSYSAVFRLRKWVVSWVFSSIPLGVMR